jgi:hypothetical protein
LNGGPALIKLVEGPDRNLLVFASDDTPLPTDTRH